MFIILFVNNITRSSNSNKNKRKIKDLTIEYLLSEQPFYNAPINNPKSNKLTNQELLQVLAFHDSVGITKKDRAFKIMFQHMIEKLWTEKV